jgi:hypothetical protein
MEPVMLKSSQDSIARFAALPVMPGNARGQRSRFFDTFLAPFRDVDQRVARLVAASEAEREMRRVAMSDAPAPRR